jgi:Polyketide cyclase / dehydrase and lipid transport
MPSGMGPISATIPIDAPRERVYEFLCDLANRPAFTDHFVSDFRLERLESAGVGAAARMRIRRRGLWMETVIEQASPPRSILERGAGGRLDRIPIRTGWELVEGPGEGCEVTARFWTEPFRPWDRLRESFGAGWFYRRQWAIALSRLKELMEADRPVARVVVAGGDRLPVT